MLSRVWEFCTAGNVAAVGYMGASVVFSAVVFAVFYRADCRRRKGK